MAKKKEVSFKSMSATQKRVAIAEDVIAALQAKRYKATSGTYVESKTTAKGFIEKSCGSNDVELKDVLAKNMKSCEVCAKGAMFVASVERFNNLKVSVSDPTDNVFEKLNGDYEVCDHLSNYFDEEQLAMIEAAFEGGEFADEVYIDDEDDKSRNNKRWTIYGYSILYPNATDRMIAIMENIIRNKGKFVAKVSEILDI